VRRYFPGGTDDESPAELIEISVDRPRPSFTALRDWLVEHIAAELKLPSDAVAPDARLDSFALQSISVAALQAGLSDWLGFRVPHTVFLEHPTIDAMAEALGGTTAPASSSPSTLLLGLTAARPFFCVGGALGAAYYLLPLARDVGSARPFYGLRAPGYDGSEAPLDTVEALAARYLESIRVVQPYGPYLLGGHSFGGVVAYEMGRQLREAGEEVTRIVLLDAYVPIPGQPLPPVDEVAPRNRLSRSFCSGSRSPPAVRPASRSTRRWRCRNRRSGSGGSSARTARCRWRSTSPTCSGCTRPTWRPMSGTSRARRT